MGSNGVMLLIIIICVILSGYFSATETAFSAINRVRIRNQAEKGNKRAALVLQLSDNYDSLLSTILIGNNIVNKHRMFFSGDNFICKASWRRDGRGNFHTGDRRCGIDFR